MSRRSNRPKGGHSKGGGVRAADNGEVTLNLYALRLADFGPDNEIVPVTESQMDRSAGELDTALGRRPCMLIADTSFGAERAAAMAAMLVLLLGFDRQVMLGLNVRFDELLSGGTSTALSDFLWGRIQEWGVRDLVLLTHLTVITELARLTGTAVRSRWGESITAPAEPQLFRFRVY